MYISQGTRNPILEEKQSRVPEIIQTAKGATYDRSCRRRTEENGKLGNGKRCGWENGKAITWSGGNVPFCRALTRRSSWNGLDEVGGFSLIGRDEIGFYC